MNYLISTAEPTIMNIELVPFVKQLQVQWQPVEIRPIDHPQRAYSLEWIILQNQFRLEGRLERNGQSVVLDGQLPDCAQFALWLRTLIDPQYKLFFYDQGYSADIELREGTTATEIINRFSRWPTSELPVFQLPFPPPKNLRPTAMPPYASQLPGVVAI
ncbi:MAG: hypothetical protein BWK78_03075 [Thiotrichaceae bacterium IS1]|nr:MAG: hypothetical protein BWK78_03075 [Thiotrichaceae bacterium IS1]